MKHFILILLFAFFSRVSYAQANTGNSAFDKYKSGDYLSAIKQYSADFFRKASIYNEFMLGLCYMKTDSLIQAKQEFERVINTTSKNPFDDGMKAEACDALANDYLQNNNYLQALYYYRLYGAIFEKAKFDDVNLAHVHFFNTYDQARCYKKLGFIDSATKIMTPYMFYSYKTLSTISLMSPDKILKDSLKHDTVWRFYLSLLQSNYSNKKIKAMFKKATQSFKFKEDRKPIDQFGYAFIYIECSIDIYGTHVIVLKIGAGNKPEYLVKDMQEPFYTKMYQFEQFKNLPICQLVGKLSE